MKKLLFLSVLFGLLTIYPVSAHMGNVSSGRFEMMQNMMGEDTIEVFQDLETQMMGTEAQERMEALMEKMFSGALTADDQKQMVELMKGQSGTGANLMMMRFMMPQIAQKTGFNSFGTMNGMMGGWGQSLTWASWLTVLLIWITLALGIAALWRYLNKP